MWHTLFRNKWENPYLFLWISVHWTEISGSECKIFRRSWSTLPWAKYPYYGKSAFHWWRYRFYIWHHRTCIKWNVCIVIHSTFDVDPLSLPLCHRAQQHTCCDWYCTTHVNWFLWSKFRIEWLILSNEH